MFKTNCWYCSQPMFVLQCTCGSAVLLDINTPPWDKHECGSGGGIGNSGLSGWNAIDVLANAGVTITTEIMDKAFGKANAASQANNKPTPPDIQKMAPKHAEHRTIMAVVRETPKHSQSIKKLSKLGELGAKMLGLNNVGKLQQATLITNTAGSADESYTCIVPETAGENISAMKNKLVFAAIEGKVAGDTQIWLVHSIHLI